MVAGDRRAARADLRVDFRTRLLPTRMVLPATAAAILLGLVGWAVTADPDDLVRAAVGLVAVRSFFWVLWWFHSAGMGFGDVRLAALLGFALGYLGVGELVVGAYAGFLVFGLPGLLLAVVRRDRALLRSAFPFGRLRTAVPQPVMTPIRPRRVTAPCRRTWNASSRG